MVQVDSNVLQMLTKLSDQIAKDKLGNDIETLLSPTDYTSKTWSKSYLEEWARLFLIIRYLVENEKMRPNSTVLREFVDDILQAILFRDQNREEQAYTILKSAIKRLPDNDDKRIRAKINTLVNLISPSDRLKNHENKKNEKEKEKATYKQSRGRYCAGTERYNAQPYTTHSHSSYMQPHSMYHHAPQYAQPMVNNSNNNIVPSPAPPRTPCAVCGKWNHSTEQCRNKPAKVAAALTHSHSSCITLTSHIHASNTDNVIKDMGIVELNTITICRKQVSTEPVSSDSIASMHAECNNSISVYDYVVPTHITKNNVNNIASYTNNTDKNYTHSHTSMHNNNEITNVITKTVLDNDANNAHENNYVAVDHPAEYCPEATKGKTSNKSLQEKINPLDTTYNKIHNTNSTPFKRKLEFSNKIHDPQCHKKIRDNESIKVELPQAPFDGSDPIRKSRVPIRKMIGHDKKNFDKYNLHCEYCEQIGHEKFFCPKRPIIYANTDQTFPITGKKYAEDLINAPSTDVSMFANMTWDEAIKYTKEVGEKYNTNNPWLPSTAPRDRLRAKLGFWKAIGASREVLSWLAHGIEMRFMQEPEHLEFKNHPSYHEHIEHVDKEHARHVATGSWLEIDKKYAKVVNPLQVEVNSRGKKRMCVDMRYPNSFTADCKFKLETLYTHLTQVVDKDDVMISTDMEQAYYSMPMHESAWPYMAWKHRDKYYCSTILTFGYNQAPMFFHKTMRVIVRLCRALGIKVLNYLDDFLWSCKPEHAKALIGFVKFILIALGWKFNDKCRFDPSTLIEFLGMLIDTEKYWITAPDEKVSRILSLTKSMHLHVSTHTWVSLHDMQVLTGTIRSVKLAIPVASAWTREMNKVIALGADNDSELYVTITTEMKERLTKELEFWISELIARNGASMSHPQYQITVHCDASVTGYGGSCGSKKVADVLPLHMIGKSSTHRELYGLRQLTIAMKDVLVNKRVKFIMDSQPAVANLSKGGGPVADLNDEIKQWLETCRHFNIEPTYEWVRREDNTEADELSKANEFRHTKEFMSKACVDTCILFSNIHGLNGVFETPTYNSIDNHIRELITDKRASAMVIPEWPAQAWWPNVMKKNRPCRLLGNSTQIYHSQQTYAQRLGFSKSIPDWKIWIVLFQPTEY